MALGNLTLSVTQGAIRRPFVAKIAGLTTGRVEVLNDGTPGFSTVNGFVRHPGLPYDVNTVVLREYDPGVGAGFKDTRIDITTIAQTVASLLPDGSVQYTGGGGAGITLSASTIDAAATGVIAQLSTGLTGTLTWSKLSGSASTLSIAASTGAVSISAALGAGNTAVLNARVQNALGDAVEKSFVLTGASTGTPTPPATTFVSTLNVMNYTKDPESTRAGRLSIFPHVLPQDTLEIKFAWPAWYLLATSTGGVTNGSNLPFVSMIAYCNGQKVTLNIGGNTAPTVAAGTNSDFTQTLTPDMFGFSGGKFPAGTIVWTATNILLANATDALPVSNRRSGDMAGSYFGWYNPANTTITNDGFNGFTTTGAAPAAQTGYGYAPWCVGKLANAGPVWLAIGDSITATKNDNATVAPIPTGLGVQTIGYFNRAVVALGVPAANFAVDSSKMAAGASASVLTYWYQFANRGWVGYAGTNDFSSAATATQVRAGVLSRLTNFRASGTITKVLTYVTLPYTTTTDAYATEANQTPVAGYGTAGEVEQYRAQIGTMGFDGVVAMSSGRGTNTLVWPANGTTDGLHPAPTTVQGMKAEAQAAMAAVA